MEALIIIREKARAVGTSAAEAYGDLRLSEVDTAAAKALAMIEELAGQIAGLVDEVLHHLSEGSQW